MLIKNKIQSVQLKTRRTKTSYSVTERQGSPGESLGVLEKRLGHLIVVYKS